MTEDSKFSYRVLQGSWGLAVDIAGHLESREQFEGQTELVTPAVSLAILPDHLSEEERSSLLMGGSIAATVLAEKSPHKEGTVLVVSEIDFHPCDFQSEALACALIGLAEELVKSKIVEVPVSFDSGSNRYEFSFPV